MTENEMTEMLTAVRNVGAYYSGAKVYSGAEVADAITALRERIAALRQPSGYAYEYPSYRGGTTIRFNGGEEVNGSKPLRAIPYVFIDAALEGKP